LRPGELKKVKRRFSEFLLLRESLTQSYQGVFVPPVPAKTYAANTDRKIAERKFMLNRFIKELVKNPILLESPEFGLFMNPVNDFKDAIKSRAPKTTVQ
jgi:hypothetical protein